MQEKPKGINMKFKFNFKRVVIFIVALLVLEGARMYGLITPQIQTYIIPILIVLYFAIGEYMDRNKAEDRFKKK